MAFLFFNVYKFVIHFNKPNFKTLKIINTKIRYYVQTYK